jgi:hypothetical protein
MVKNLATRTANAQREKLRRRALRAADRALTELAGRLVGVGRAVPIMPPSHLDLPPETRFPFF